MRDLVVKHFTMIIPQIVTNLISQVSSGIFTANVDTHQFNFTDSSSFIILENFSQH